MKQTHNSCLSTTMLALFTVGCQPIGMGHAGSASLWELSTVVSPHDGMAQNISKAEQFAQTHWSNLTSDMARGDGEYLDILATLLAVQSTQKATFFAMTKTQFSQLIPSIDTTPAQLISHLKVEMNLLTDERH